MTTRPADRSGRTLPHERDRGTLGMILFVLTEGSLFVVLFFAYYFLAANNPAWPIGEPPRLRLAIPMTVLLVTSSVVLHWGERAMRSERHARARLAVAGTLLLAATFLGLQVLEYRDHLQSLTPQSNAYGSIFYTITSFHAFHLILGTIMLLFVLVVPRLESHGRPPYRPLHVVALYWHFVDGVWLVILTTLYVVPNLRA